MYGWISHAVICLAVLKKTCEATALKLSGLSAEGPAGLRPSMLATKCPPWSSFMCPPWTPYLVQLSEARGIRIARHISIPVAWSGDGIAYSGGYSLLLAEARGLYIGPLRCCCTGVLLVGHDTFEDGGCCQHQIRDADWVWYLCSVRVTFLWSRLGGTQ